MKLTSGLLMLVVALLAGVAAVVMASRWMQAHTKDSGQIAVAAVDIEIGAKLAPEQLKLVEWPSNSVPPGAFTDLVGLEGRKTSITRGEPLIEGKLAPVGTRGGLSAVVAEGKRAMTVRVNDVVGVAGFAQPGNYVDIKVNTQNDGGKRGEKDKAISKIVLERILVLAVAQESDRDATKPKVVNAVTLEVSPEHAEMLDLARSVGALSLVLRNQADPKPGDTAGATKATLLNEELAPVVMAAVPAAPPPAVRRAAPPPALRPIVAAVERTCVEVIRGTSRTNECF